MVFKWYASGSSPSQQQWPMGWFPLFARDSLFTFAFLRGGISYRYEKHCENWVSHYQNMWHVHRYEMERAAQRSLPMMGSLKALPNHLAVSSREMWRGELTSQTPLVCCHFWDENEFCSKLSKPALVASFRSLSKLQRSHGFNEANVLGSFYCWWFRNPGSTHQLRLVGWWFFPSISPRFFSSKRCFFFGFFSTIKSNFNEDSESKIQVTQSSKNTWASRRCPIHQRIVPSPCYSGTSVFISPKNALLPGEPPFKYHPWDWYIYLHFVDFMVNVCKFSVVMIPNLYIGNVCFTKQPSILKLVV